MISVITPVWNQAHHTEHYLWQSWQLCRESEAEWVIVDNGSTDRTPNLLDQRYREIFGDRLRVITNPGNKGFSVACNQGAREARGEVLLFLNNDIIVFGDYLKYLNRVDDSRLAGPELHTRDTGWNRFGLKLIPYLAGWCLALTKMTFGELGGFDERYSPADYEDVDLCYAASQAGKTLVRLDDLPVRHISGESGRMLPDRLAITRRNRVKFAEKWNLPL